MPPKGKPRNVWAWVDGSNYVEKHHVESVYRIDGEKNKCQPGQCRNNCSGNPFCLNSIGESSWLKEINEAYWNNSLSDPNDECRKPNDFVGLKNLGATCYVNSIIQVLFHNHTVRRAVYEWRSTIQANDAKPDWSVTEVDGESQWSPTSDISHLQCLFALLEKSRRKYIDPTPLIQQLGLNSIEQQDAQEFAKLFVDLMIRRNVSPILKQQFSGSYVYITKCETCHCESRRTEDYTELQLNIQGLNSLDSAIKHFFKAELLEGDNKYDCMNCVGLRVATRNLELKTLPVVLNLQLMRFVYDITTGSKKKLKTNISFPNSIKISDYTCLVGPDDDAVYDLTAVLIHRGPTAYSGHYIAHIRDQQTDAWYRFNDEVIDKMQGNKLHLGTEDDIEETNIKNGRTNKTIPAHHHSSKNAYMLVYTRRSSLNALKQHNVQIISPQKKTKLVSKCDSDKSATPDILTKKSLDINCSLSETLNSDFDRTLSCESLSNNRVVNSDKQTCSVLLEDLTDSPPHKLKISPCDVNKIKNSKTLKFVSSIDADDNVHRMKADGVSMNENFDAMVDSCRDVKCEIIQETVNESAELQKGQHVQSSSDNKNKSPEVNINSAGNNKPLIGTISDKKTCKQITNVLTNVLTIDKPIMVSECQSAAQICNDIQLKKQKNNKKKSGDNLLNENKRQDAEEGLQKLVNTESDSVANRLLPNYVLDYVKNDDDRFQAWISNIQSVRDNNVSDGKKLQEHVCKIYEELWTHPRTEYEFISLDWLHRWFKDPKEVTAISNDHLLCPHRKLDFAKMSKVKAVSPSSADKLYSTYSGGPRLKKDSMCLECVQSKFNKMRLKKKIDDDDKAIKAALKSSSTSQDDLYVVGRNSLRRWRSLALAIHDDAANGQTDHDHSKTSDRLSPVDEAATNQSPSSSQSIPSSPIKTYPSIELSNQSTQSIDNVNVSTNFSQSNEENLYFNEDILCEHGNLSHSTDTYRPIPGVAWSLLKSYFPSCPTYTINSPTCSICSEVNADEPTDISYTYKDIAQTYKQSLEQLYQNRGRPSWVKQEVETVFVLRKEFIEEWRKFIRDPTSNEPITEIVNSHMICDHGGLVYDIQDLVDSDYHERFVYVWPTEWTTMLTYLTVDFPVTICRLVDESQTVYYNVTPDICKTCVHKRKEQEQLSQYVYTNATVYIRQQTPKPKSSQIISLDTTDSDLDYNEPSPKRKKCTEVTIEDTRRIIVEPPSCRRSSRHHKVKGEKSVTISSSETLRDLKIKVMAVLGVAPIDQEIYMNNTHLSSLTSTLGDMRIMPESVLTIKVEECQDFEFYEQTTSSSVSSHIETGFLGTGLISD